MLISAKTLRLCFLLLLGTSVLISCKEEEEEPSTGGGTPAARTQYFRITALGTTLTQTLVTGTRTTGFGEEYLDVEALLTNGGFATFEGRGELTAGFYPINSTSTDMGFAFVTGANEYTCTDCQVQVLTHDLGDNYFKAKISGTVSFFDGGITLATAPLDNAEFAVFYD